MGEQLVHVSSSTPMESNSTHSVPNLMFPTSTNIIPTPMPTPTRTPMPTHTRIPTPTQLFNHTQFTPTHTPSRMPSHVPPTGQLFDQWGSPVYFQPNEPQMNIGSLMKSTMDYSGPVYGLVNVYFF